jgi:hypothetical protein
MFKGKSATCVLVAALFGGLLPAGLLAQAPPLAPAQLDELVQRIALYPDPLLAQVLTASTYRDQIPGAAAWADEHSYLQGDALAQAIADDNLSWDSSVLALLPFPSVLDAMSRDQRWTQSLGNAVLTERGEVMDAVQRMRREAYDYGYLRSSAQDRVIVTGPGAIQILPVDPDYICVPTYNPLAVFVRPRGGLITGVISFGPRIFVGGLYQRWGWLGFGFAWPSHEIVINHHPWGRTWANRRIYVHPWAGGMPHRPGPRVERHPIHRSESARAQRPQHEEHHDHDR